MSGLPADPIRLCEQRDQPCLAERVAGAAARELSLPARFSPGAMARVAMDIEARRVRKIGAPRRNLVLVLAALLLGIATAASAAHLNLVPRWITHVLQRRPSRPAANKTASPRPAAAKSPAAPTPTTIATGEVLPDAVASPESTDAPTPARLQPVEVGGIASGSGAGRHWVVSAGARPREARRPIQVAILEQDRVAPSPSAEPAAPLPAPPGSSTSPYPAWPSESMHASVVDRDRGLSAEPMPVASAAAASLPHASPKVVQTGSANSLGPTQQPTTYLKEIVRALRIDHAPARALALIDRHAADLNGGAFAGESLVLRVEAMLALGQRAAVLRLLDGTPLADAAASRTLLLIRGELRVSADRCAEGIGDLDLVLARAPRPPKQALLGRARCKQRMGDPLGALADFEAYRREYGEATLAQPESRSAKRPGE
jgi:hypothetical protein